MLASVPVSETFKIVYTCKRCETRNMIEIKRVSWNEGVVIATCQGCNAKHVLADANGLLDLTNELNFTNAVDEARKKGEYVNQLNDNDLERLGEFFLEKDEDGVTQLVPRSGDEVVVRKDKVSV